MDTTDTTRILDYLKRIDAKLGGAADKEEVAAKDSMPAQFAAVHERLTTMDERFDGVDTRLDKVDTRLRTMDTRFDSVDDKLERLDTRVSEVQLGLATLAATTKKNFHAVDQRFNQVDAKFASVDAKFAGVDQRFVSAQRHVDAKFMVHSAELASHMERLYKELSGRLEDVEPPCGGTGGGSGTVLTS
ncbi:MAG: hypothetical protein NTY02_13200 [Acidobacteria bacterium]|nr:hypothetical protein [Acidobacteriota bacterium]